MAVLHPPGGPDVVISVTAAGVRMQVGESATWVVSVMHDVTASDQLDRMRDQFFAAAAHSLKTPVAIVKADVQALLPYETREQRRVADSIARQCDRIDRLIQNLLVLTRAHSHSLELHPSAMHLRPLIERISVERTWSHRHDLRTDLTGSLPLHADPERIGLAIRNLLYEAYLLSPADSRLTLLARAEGDRVAVGFPGTGRSWQRTANTTTSASGGRSRRRSSSDTVDR
jgi:two-component system sensor histidine kinase SenX3